MKIIFPITYYHYRGKRYYANPKIPHDGPLFFLAGPIPGGGNWQAEAYELLKRKLKTPFVVASPCHFQMALEVEGERNRFIDQMEWEVYWSNLAADEGCVIFWLPAENKYCPRNDGRPYAMMSRDEVGKFRQKLVLNRNAKVVMGGEKGFPGLPEIERYNEIELGEGVLPIHSTLEETIDAGIIRAHAPEQT